MLYTSEKISTLRFLALLVLGMLAFTSSAQSDYSNPIEDTSIRLFSTYESNGRDYIEGIGVGFASLDPRTKLGLEFSTSINNAKIMATDGYIEEFLAWQGTARYGLFSIFSVYAEIGLDLTELLFHDLRYGDHDEHQEEYHNDIDAFVGVGAGVRAGQFVFEAFTRLRAIDSLHWEAESEVFNGAQLSISF
ncbi:MAG: hypothetical protein GY763_13585 [Gammaproteobacteria bacterium]|nr:hypothetical protein [Gammaproteobacteria bacterium]